jgi:hypothetical protein
MGPGVKGEFFIRGGSGCEDNLHVALIKGFFSAIKKANEKTADTSTQNRQLAATH